jgi:hypothetical protein
MSSGCPKVSSSQELPESGAWFLDEFGKQTARFVILSNKESFHGEVMKMNFRASLAIKNALCDDPMEDNRGGIIVLSGESISL